jgi:hypothetical protein
MNYLEAKLELMKRAPGIPFKLIAIEAAALVIVAAVLVRFFA